MHLPHGIFCRVPINSTSRVPSAITNSTTSSVRNWCSTFETRERFLTLWVICCLSFIPYGAEGFIYWAGWKARMSFNVSRSITSHLFCYACALFFCCLNWYSTIPSYGNMSSSLKPRSSDSSYQVIKGAGAIVWSRDHVMKGPSVIVWRSKSSAWHEVLKADGSISSWASWHRGKKAALPHRLRHHCQIMA